MHARISEDLEEALKREARRRRSPVSLVVRNVLEGALDLVEEIVEDSLQIARRSRHFARNVQRAGNRNHGGTAAGDAVVEDSTAGLDDIYGWQELILNRTVTCSRCATGLAAGANAYRGLRDHAGPAVFLCASCVRRLRQPARPTEEETR